MYERMISEHFSVAENRCHCGECTRATADVELVTIMEWLRGHYNAKLGHVDNDLPMNVNSWFRCRAHNNRPKHLFSDFGVQGVGSNDNSMHPTGGAADVWIPGVDPVNIAATVRERYPSRLGVGIYDTFTHIDVRENRADWDLRSNL